uniref:BTB domain-containing protein n=1 Tax=Erpetoichthys calabaricus TaxID=27687 RepID=A0A8C4SVF6_ERPCA
EEIKGTQYSDHGPNVNSTTQGMDYNVLNELRLEESFVDVVLIVNGVEFPAHKNVLCCCSPYFRTLFSSRWNKRKKVYNIPEMSSDIMELIIMYAYSQSVPITSGNVEELLSISSQFGIPGLSSLCMDFLESQLCLENCIGICKLAYYYCCPELHLKAFKFAIHNFEELIGVSEEFLRLDFSELCDIIERDELNVRNESLVFIAVIKWIYHKPSERKEFLTELLTKVRLALNDSSLFLEKVKKFEYMRGSVEYKLFIYRVLLKMIHDLSIREAAAQQPRYSIVHSRLPYSILLAIGGWRGGRPTNTIEAYDVRAKIWRDVTCTEEMPRASFETAFVKGYVYFVGQFDKVENYNRVHRFDPVKRVWQEVAPMHTRRGFVSIAVNNYLIYAMGGVDGHTCFNMAEQYNAETNQWTLLSSMNERRCDASATTLHGKIYICGGNNGNDCLSTAEVYDPIVDQWSMIAPMTIQRSGMGVIAYKDEVYAVGGFEGENDLKTAEAYNPQTDTWRSVSSMINARSYFGIETMEDLLYVVGGNDDFTTYAKVECYNKESDEWKEVPEMNVDRCSLSCCVLSGLPNIREYAARREPLQPVHRTAECRLSPFYNMPPL